MKEVVVLEMLLTEDKRKESTDKQKDFKSYFYPKETFWWRVEEKKQRLDYIMNNYIDILFSEVINKTKVVVGNEEDNKEYNK